MSYETDVLARLRSALVGKTIVKVEYMNAADARRMGWSNRPIVIVAEGGTVMFPLSDDEGNNGGALATSILECETVGVLSVT
jgi:hypothetical protein